MMKNKGKRIICIIILVCILLVGLIPVKSKLDDGGTVIYSAMFYKVIVWNQLYVELDDNLIHHTETHTGTSIYIFPFNFGQKEWHPK